MKIIFSILFLIFSGLFLTGQNVQIKGNNPLFVGKTIFFCTYTDQITYLFDTLCTSNVDANGNFNCSFFLDEIKPVFTSFGAYKYLIYAEPRKIYTVTFPDIKDKSKADDINPYFEEITLFLKIENSDRSELNNAIFRFDLTCNDYINARYNEIYKQAKNSGVDKMINYIDSLFSFCNHPYFIKYKEYKYALIKYFAYVRHEQTMTREFYKGKPVLYHNTSYMNLFNQTFDNYFTYFAKTTEGSTLPDLIGKAKSPRRIKNLLKKNNAYDDEVLQELIILKGLRDVLLSGEYSKNVIIQTLDSLGLQTSVPFHKTIAGNIVKLAMQKEPAVSLNTIPLFNTDSTAFNTEKFKGKFVYLNFCRCKSYPCLEESELIKIWNKKKPFNIEFITVFVEETAEIVRIHHAKNKADWTILYCPKSEPILKTLKVRAYPAYFLFDTDGKMLMPYAKTMKEGFESFFMRTFK
ncbi:MAG: hypothetical protein A2275_03045 [Bacteroidetes bacterium RIFOXYA12_FULL_35_11]|nr:MAG: hypothetical protein A2X01_15535 [Bacteroidetes bacterium GWF2_35_48]OFY77763.1 MAG: hypothetical protein A2275_03045 [Bacteroidetes bacterium RIFOXYA12_FULL_35_11]OFY94360.1 MAG: hypothetical protein A2491_00605 [Bacteroidetes bacterium RIFOXYC12_FULL_35_7]OFY97032.1 MAG: hypothetical protein A2309_07945 [Bacteroidetes bacterium RIFOXYB2_FULL_35_7]HBX49860.1 hypothetical protein [Bacteroidales bacterium]